MKRDFSRAVISAGVLAAVGFVLVYAALRPRPAHEPSADPRILAADSCTTSLARWGDLERMLTRAAALAADVGARCRLLTCPELDCTELQDLRATVTSLAGALQRVAAVPALVTDRRESSACGAVVAPLAKRLQPGLQAARQALDLCAAQASCTALRRARKGEGSVFGQLRTEAGRLEALAGGLRLGESPAVGVKLDLVIYLAGDAMQARIDGERNRCLARGGTVGVYRDNGARSLAGAPLSQEPLVSAVPAKLFLEAPQAPGRYLVAVSGRAGPRRALGIAPFDVEAAAKRCSGFAGRWETDRGMLTASVRQGVLRATYRRAGAVKPGFLTGHVKGRHFHGTWVSELGSGGAHLVLNGDGDRFLGTAGGKPGEEDGAGLWRGRCVIAPPQRVRNR